MAERCEGCPLGAGTVPLGQDSCEGPVTFIKDVGLVHDLQKGMTLQAAEVGAVALSEVCGATVSQDPDTIIVSDSDGRYGVQVSGKVAKLDDEVKRDLVRGCVADYADRSQRLYPLSWRPQRAELASVQATPGEQLWAEINAAASDEVVKDNAIIGAEAIETAQALLGATLQGSPAEQAIILNLCDIALKNQQGILETESLFKDEVSQYLQVNAATGSAKAMATLQSRYEALSNEGRQYEPIAAQLGVTYLDEVIRQVADASEILLNGGFAVQSAVMHARWGWFQSVTEGSKNDHIEQALRALAQQNDFGFKGIVIVNNIMQELNDIITRWRGINT